MEYITDVWNWTIIASIVGMFTGVLALVISVLNHRRVGAMKSLDLRLEVGRTKNSLKTAIKYMDTLNLFSKNSGLALSTIIDGAESDKLEQLTLAWEKDAESNTRLQNTFDEFCTKIKSTQLKDMEQDLIFMHGKLEEVGRMTDKYNMYIAECNRIFELALNNMHKN